MLEFSNSSDLYSKKLIKSLSGSLAKSFKLTSYKDLDKTVFLANYFFSLGEIAEAKKILESFVFKVPYKDDRQDLWGSNGQGIVLLAHICGLEGHEDERVKVISIVFDNDIRSDRCGRYDLFIEHYEDHNKKMDYAFSETQKYKCEVIGQEALTFLYFYEMLPFYKNEVTSDFESRVKGIVDYCYAELKKALIG